jgi:hypothetical protein
MYIYYADFSHFHSLSLTHTHTHTHTHINIHTRTRMHIRTLAGDKDSASADGKFTRSRRERRSSKSRRARQENTQDSSHSHSHSAHTPTHRTPLSGDGQVATHARTQDEEWDSEEDALLGIVREKRASLTRTHTHTQAQAQASMGGRPLRRESGRAHRKSRCVCVCERGEMRVCMKYACVYIYIYRRIPICCT